MPSKRWKIVALLLLAAGCSKPIAYDGREVAARLADELYASGARVAGTTDTYPRAAIQNDTRVILKMPRTNHLGGVLAIATTVPKRTRLELAYGMDGEGGGATFKITADSGVHSQILLEDRVEGGDGWKEARIDLGAWEGKTEFRFEARADEPEAGSSGQPRAYFTAPVLTRTATKPRPTNVILISLDTLRADHLGIYGYGRDTSPTMDRLFGLSGVVVDRTIAQSTETFYGHMAMMTGMRPTTAVTTTKDNVIGRQRDWVLNIAEIMRSAGYRTAAATENALLMGPVGYNRGFEAYYEEKGVQRRGKLKVTGGHIERTLARGLAWLEGHQDESFFLFLHTYQVHNPYLPPPAYNHLFRAPKGAPRSQRTDVDRYDRLISYTDDEVAGFLERLKQMGLLENTLLVITADHGEEFGEHGGRLHGAHLTSEILHVPMLMHAPGLLPEGVRRSGPMALMDLLPTLVDLLGLDTPKQIGGRSMAAHILEGEAVAPAPLFSEARSPYAFTYNGMDKSWIRPAFAVTHWPHRLVRIRTPKGPRYELYDLDEDPGETENLYAANTAPLIHKLKRSLDGYQNDCEARARALAAELVGKRNVATAEAHVVDKAREEKLRALGYIQ